MNKEKAEHEEKVDRTRDLEKSAKSDKGEKRVDTSPKTKNITIAKVKREAKKINKMETYELNDTDRIRYYPVFPQLKINKMVKELAEVIGQAVDEDIQLTDENIINHTLFLSIKHFTHLEKQLSDNFKEQVQELNYLIDTGLFKTIVSDIFMAEEIEKVLDSLGDILSTDMFVQHVEESALDRLEQLKTDKMGLLSMLDDKEVDREIERLDKKYEDDLKN